MTVHRALGSNLAPPAGGGARAVAALAVLPSRSAMAGAAGADDRRASSTSTCRRSSAAGADDGNASSCRRPRAPGPRSRKPPARRGRRADRVGTSADLLSMTVSARRTGRRSRAGPTSCACRATRWCNLTATCHRVHRRPPITCWTRSGWPPARGTARRSGSPSSTRASRFNSNFNWTIGFWDFTQHRRGRQPGRRRSKTKPYDDYGHGTHVAGLIANNGNFAEGVYRGVAPYVALLRDEGAGSAKAAGLTSNVIRAIDFAVANKDTLLRSTSSTCRWGTRSSNRRRPIRSCRRSNGPCGRASWWWCRPATSAATRRRAWSATPASRRPATRRRRSPSARSTPGRPRRGLTM